MRGVLVSPREDLEHRERRKGRNEDGYVVCQFNLDGRLRRFVKASDVHPESATWPFNLAVALALWSPEGNDIQPHPFA
jgi:hypothetical protein